MAADPAYRPVNAQTVATMSPTAQADIQKARTLTLLNTATQHRAPDNQRAAPDANHALLQKAHGQDRTQPALSPTDQFNGRTAVQARLEGATLARNGVTHSPAAPDHTPTPSHTPHVPNRGMGYSR